MPRDASLPFRSVLDAAPDGIVVCDGQGTLVLVNNEAERMFGYDRDELLGQPIDLLLPEPLRARHQLHMTAYATAPRSRPMASSLELHARCKDGREIPVEIGLSPLAAERGLLIIAGIRDVSDRRKLEREKQRATSYLRSAMEAVQEAFLLFDENDRVMMVNSGARALMGPVGDAPAIGRTFEELLDASIAAGTYDLEGASVESWRARRLAYHRDPGGVLDLRAHGGRTVRITERKTAERGTVTMIADITEEVQRAEELRRARAQAEAASDAKSEFLSSMSHELRTPLNAILGFAQLLERDRKQPLSDRQLERLSHVLRGGEHLLRLIDDVLDLSRIESGRLAVSLEPVEIGGVLAEVVHTLAPMAARANVRLLPPDLPARVAPVVADRTRLAQVLMNFGSNAIKYGRSSGYVVFHAAAGPRTVRITVIDNGMGIPDDKRDRMFDPFQRAGQEAGPIEGTGIGLAISKRLAELMRGSVGFRSQVNQGSEFWIELPAHVEVATGAAGKPEGAGRRAILATGEHRHTIVYVEDNPSNIAFMRDLLEDLPSVELLTAPTAEIGLELIRGRRPTVVIVDINLPGISGFEAVKRLRAWPETRQIPVIGLSAAALTKDLARAHHAGFDRYLTKPVKVDEMLETLEHLLEGRSPAHR